MSTVETVRDLAREAWSLEAEKKQIEERLTSVNKQLQALYFQKLPAAMDEAEVDFLGVPAKGNLPAFGLEIKPFVKASIAASWPEDRRAAAIRTLDEHGAGDLIKTEVSTLFPREDRHKAIEFAQTAKTADAKATVVVKETVNAMTLTAWLNEQLRQGNPIPPLDAIGGTIARMAKIKEREANG